MADSELAELDQLKARASKVSERVQCFASTSPSPSSLDWEDDLLTDDSLDKKIYDITKERTGYLDILHRFWYFYLSGLTQKGFTVFETIVDPLLIFVEIDDKIGVYKTIWAETDLTDVEEEAIYVPRLVSFDEFIKWDNIKSSTIFHKFISAKLDTLDPMEGYLEDKEEEEVLLSKFTAYLSLTFFRGLIKNKTQLRDSFLEAQYKKNIALLIGDEYCFNYEPPCTLCIQNVLTGLSTDVWQFKEIFARLVGNYVRRKREGVENANTCSVLEASVLNDTAGYGIEMMYLLTSATRYLACGWFDIFNRTNILQLKQGWQRIIDFLERYCEEGKIQYGYPWARIINDGFLKEYSPKKNLPICAMLAGIFSDDYDEIWGEKWIKIHRHEVASWIDVGRAAAAQILNLENDIQGNTKALSTLQTPRVYSGPANGLIQNAPAGPNNHEVFNKNVEEPSAMTSAKGPTNMKHMEKLAVGDLTGIRARKDVMDVQPCSPSCELSKSLTSLQATHTYRAVIQSEGSIYARKAKAIKFLMTTQDATKSDEHLIFWENNTDDVEELLDIGSSRLYELFLKGLKIGPECAVLVLAALSEGQTIQRKLNDENTVSVLRKPNQTIKKIVSDENAVSELRKLEQTIQRKVSDDNTVPELRKTGQTTQSKRSDENIVSELRKLEQTIQRKVSDENTVSELGKTGQTTQSKRSDENTVSELRKTGQTTQSKRSDENTASELRKVLESDKMYYKQFVSKAAPRKEVAPFF